MFALDEMSRFTMNKANRYEIQLSKLNKKCEGLKQVDDGRKVY